MRHNSLLILQIFFILFLTACNEQPPKSVSIEDRSKTINCILNDQNLEIVISKGTLTANFIYDGKSSLVNLLKFKDTYQILMKFDPQIGQLKINQLGTELTQFINQQKIRTACKTITRD
jgi:hypothetical protein